MSGGNPDRVSGAACPSLPSTANPVPARGMAGASMTVTCRTTAFVGASPRTAWLNASSAVAGPAASMRTSPPTLRTVPSSPRPVATRYTKGRKPTPWTVPRTWIDHACRATSSEAGHAQRTVSRTRSTIGSTVDATSAREAGAEAEVVTGDREDHQPGGHAPERPRQLDGARRGRWRASWPRGVRRRSAASTASSYRCPAGYPGVAHRVDDHRQVGIGPQVDHAARLAVAERQGDAGQVRRRAVAGRAAAPRRPARRRRRGGTRCRRRSPRRDARAHRALHGEIEEVGRAGDARVVVADRLLALRGSAGASSRSQPGRRRTGAGRPRCWPGSARWAARSGRTVIEPVGVELVAVEQHAARRLGGAVPDAGARARRPPGAARAARTRSISRSASSTA